MNSRLPNGDVLEHAVVQFVSAKGEMFDGRGVLPDQPVTLSRERLIAGEDAAQLAARQWIEHARPRVRR
jgi:carboxyl-terminal processing protease